MDKYLKKPQKPQRHVANAFNVYSRLFVYTRRYWVALIFAVIASMLYSGVNAWFVGFLKPLIDKGFIDNNLHFMRRAPCVV